MTMSNAAARHLCRRKGQRGAHTTAKITQFITRSGRRACKISWPLFRLFFCDLPRSLICSNKWLWLPSLQSTSAADRGEGALGGQNHHCPCFGFVEMIEQGPKAKPFYNVVTNSECRVRIRFLTLSQLVKPLRISILFGFNKMDPK